VTRRDLVGAFAERSGYFNTFGGNPVSSAAALAVLDVIANEGLQENALNVGQHIADRLWSLAEKHECIGDIRGTGLFLALDLVADRADRTPATALAARVVNDLCSHGVLTGSIGPHANILKLRPPLVVSSEDADYMIDILDDSLSRVIVAR
jgi:4-aminobutyrate aminotransferase-like enzyme